MEPSRHNFDNDVDHDAPPNGPAATAAPGPDHAACVSNRGRPRTVPAAEVMIAAARKVYEDIGQRPMRIREFLRFSGFTPWQLRCVFDGGWTELLMRAGIPRHPGHMRRYEDDELLAEFHRIAVKLGHVPRWIDFNRHGRISAQPYLTRFGQKARLVERYREWLEEREPDSPLLALCGSAYVERRVGRRRCRRARPDPATVLGEPISLKNFRHAPTNELGVVLLFGMLCEELGFAVQRVGIGFPDCEAMRAVDAARTQWERVRIEFEHRSRNFRDHGHDPQGCDLVVCWRHDWPECPLEVLELATELRAA